MAEDVTVVKGASIRLRFPGARVVRYVVDIPVAVHHRVQHFVLKQCHLPAVVTVEQLSWARLLSNFKRIGNTFLNLNF